VYVNNRKTTRNAREAVVTDIIYTVLRNYWRTRVLNSSKLA
jgi:hypothetical protein